MWNEKRIRNEIKKHLPENGFEDYIDPVYEMLNNTKPISEKMIENITNLCLIELFDKYFESYEDMEGDERQNIGDGIVYEIVEYAKWVDPSRQMSLEDLVKTESGSDIWTKYDVLRSVTMLAIHHGLMELSKVTPQKS